MLSFLNSCIGTFIETCTERHTEMGDTYFYQTLYDKNMQDVENRKRIAFFITHENSRYEREVLREPLIHIDRRLGLKDIAVTYYVYNLTTNINYAYDVVSSALREHDLDAIIAVGDHPSRTIRDVRASFGFDIPFFFTAVIDPVNVGLLDAFGRPMDNTTGSQLIQPAYDGPLAFIDSIKPTMKNILMPYDENGPKSLVNPGKSSMYEQLVAMKFNVDMQAVSEKLHSRAPFFKNVGDYDTIILDGHASIARTNITDLVELCGMVGTTLIATNATSVYEGAALGFGNTGTVGGQVLSDQVVQHFVQKRDINSISARDVYENPNICFNQQTMREQGVDVDIATEFSLNASPVADRYTDQTQLTIR